MGGTGGRDAARGALRAVGGGEGAVGAGRAGGAVAAEEVLAGQYPAGQLQTAVLQAAGSGGSGQEKLLAPPEMRQTERPGGRPAGMIPVNELFAALNVTSEFRDDSQAGKVPAMRLSAKLLPRRRVRRNSSYEKARKHTSLPGDELVAAIYVGAMKEQDGRSSSKTLVKPTK